MAIWVLLFIFILQQFDGWYLGPKILEEFTLFPWLEGFSTLLLELLLLLLPELFLGFSKFPLVFILGTYS